MPWATHAVLAAFVLLGSTAEGQRVASADPVQFAGIAYRDDSTRFPVVRTMLASARARQTPVEAALLSALERAGVPVRTDLSVSQRAVALAFVFEQEYQRVERYNGGLTKRSTVITAQLLSIDFDTQVIQAAYPFVYEFIDVDDPNRKGDETQRIVSQILPAFLDTTSAGVFRDLIEAVQALPPMRSRCTARITAIHADGPTLQAGAEHFGGDTTRILRSLASAIGGQLTASARLPLLPYQEDRARASMMRASFANGEIFNLRIPEHDYSIVIDSLRTRRATVGRSASRRIDATGLQYVIRVAFEENTIASGAFRMVQLDTVPASRAVAESWSDVLANAKVLSATIGTNTIRRNEAWFRQNDLARTAFPALPNWLRDRCSNQ